jgi:serine/threonine protein kinase
VSTSNKSVFRTSALLSRLVTPEQIDRAVEVLCADSSGPYRPLTEISDDALAAKLVEMHVLTTYQAEQLKAGRTKLSLGPYNITDWIGQGGMGQVFKAEHEVLGRESAVKVLPLSKATPEAISHFSREIRTQAKLDHPHLVRAYDAGHDGNVHYLVVEYVPGTDLRRLVRGQGPLTLQQAASIVMQAARGLEHAHSRGLIHRDVKPGNILVTPEGVAKVSDLGLAGYIHEAEEDPRAGKIVGTADYIAPEQIKSPGETTARSDIYSLGCTLYYAITGKVPFPGGTPANKARRHCEETPWHPRRFNPEISEEFVEIIADMMEKDPKSRIQTAAEVAARLEPWASEASPIPSQQMSKSPWMPPPLPTGRDEEYANLHDTGSATYDPADLAHEAPSQLSQGTDPVASSGQDTKRVSDSSRPPAPPPLLPVHDHRRLSRTECVALTLAIAVPVAMLLGGLIGFLIGSWVR